MSWEWSRSDLIALEEFLFARGLCDGPVSVQRIGDGHSNLTFLVTSHQESVVVRRGPPPPVPRGAHDMMREAKLLAALSATDVPVPRLLAIGQAGEVIDVPFYVMSYCPGLVLTTITPSPLDIPQERHRIGEALIDTLAAIHAVDWRAAGLESIGRPDDFNRRHLHRMRRLISDPGGELPPAFRAVESWLEERIPFESGASIVHNDFRLGNVILSADAPARVLAVLDWELATIGDPLFDLGCFLTSYPEPGEELTPTMLLGSAQLEPGYPARSELVERYAKLTGSDLSNLDWYRVLALWKLAVLYEYGRRRADDGSGDSYYSDQALVDAFLSSAQRIIESEAFS